MTQTLLVNLMAAWPPWPQWLITALTLVSVAGFATSEYLANNPNVKPNSVWEWARAIYAANAEELPVIENIAEGIESPVQAVEAVTPIVNAELTAVMAKLAAIKGA